MGPSGKAQPAHPAAPGRQATHLEGDFRESPVSLGEWFLSVFKCGPHGQKTFVEGLVVSIFFFIDTNFGVGWSTWFIYK